MHLYTMFSFGFVYYPPHVPTSTMSNRPPLPPDARPANTSTIRLLLCWAPHNNAPLNESDGRLEGMCERARGVLCIYALNAVYIIFISVCY